MNTKHGSNISMKVEETLAIYSAPTLVVLGSAADLTQGSSNNIYSDASAFSGQGTQVSGNG